MKILVIISLFPPYFSGAANFLINLSKELIKKNFNVTVLTAGDRSLPKHEIIEKIKVIRKGRHFRKRSRSLFLIEGTIWLIFNMYKFDICFIAGDPDIAIFARIIAKIYRKKIITWTTLFGSDDPISVKRRKTGFLRYPSYLLSDAFISISYPITQSFKKARINMRKVFQIPNMVDVEKFRPVSEEEKIKIRKKLALPIDKFIVISVGAIEYRKGWDVLIKAFKKVKEQGFNVFLLGVGPNRGVPERERFYKNICNYIIENKLSKNILFTGEVKCVEKYMQASDIFVFPSRKEGLPNVVTEAMAVGLPCIVSDLDGISANDIFEEEESGIIINSYQSEKYAEFIIKLIRDHTLREKIGRKAREIAVSKFSKEIITNKYIQLFLKLCTK